MPIRINLLAEQQALEEARRRDPVKRTVIWAGILAVCLLLWAGLLQFQITQAQQELNSVEAKLRDIEENSKDLHAAWTTNGQIETRLAELEKYSTNRFFWGSALNALQQTVMDNVRLVQFRSTHNYTINAESRFRTNIVIPVPPQSKWRVWEAKPQPPDIAARATSQLEAALQRPIFVRFQDHLTTRVQYTTNQARVSAAIEVNAPQTASETIVLSLFARDYSSPPGRQVNEYLQQLVQFPYFKQNLNQMEGQGVRLRERGIQPEVENDDPFYPGRAFIPFIIECRYQEGIRAL